MIDREPISSFTSTLFLLALYQATEPLPYRAIADRVGISPNTGHMFHVLVRLCEQGFLTRWQQRLIGSRGSEAYMYRLTPKGRRYVETNIICKLARVGYVPVALAQVAV